MTYCALCDKAITGRWENEIGRRIWTDTENGSEECASNSDPWADHTPSIYS